MSTDLRTVLTPDDVAALRAGYSRTVMNTLATQAVAAPYPPVLGLVQFAASGFFPTDASTPLLAPADRERVLLGLFAGGRRPPFTLAVHVYWGLAEGLEVDEICAILTLAALYGGLDVQTDAMQTAGATLGILKQQVGAASADPAATTSKAILPLLLARFP